ncbi:MAG: SAM-dependent methyltransferase, partial [Rhodovibrionaceae bacterium]|nr:SAM-dependent methyltransferase [Rhodovibrionaceae bacterium]
MQFLAVAFIAAGIIGYEILLIRLYAITQWHHFAFMVISIALLGFGVSGTALSLVRPWAIRRLALVWPANAFLFGLCAVAGFALAQRLTVNPMELAWNPALFARVGLIYLLLMLPFFFGANCIGLTFAAFGRSSGRIYRFDLVG